MDKLDIVFIIIIAALIFLCAYMAFKDNRIEWLDKPVATFEYKDKTCFQWESGVYNKADGTPIVFNRCMKRGRKQ